MPASTKPRSRDAEDPIIPADTLGSSNAPSFGLIAVYAVLSAVGLATALFVGWYISVHLHEFQNQGVVDKAYYLLLLILGLAAAAFLFGAMRSTATLQGKHLGVAFDIGGPAAGALLVVVGGFWLTKPPPTFDLTVRLSGPVRSDISDTWIEIDLGERYDRISPDQLGNAIDKQLREDLKQKEVRLKLDSKQYRLSEPNKIYTMPTDNVLRVSVERIPLALPGTDHILIWWSGDGLNARIGEIAATSNGVFGYAEGIDGRAFNFSGDGFLQASASNLPAGSKDRTIELWFLLSSLPEEFKKQMTFLCYGAVAKDYEEICLLYSKEFGVAVSNYGQGNSCGETSANKWHHLAVTIYSSQTTTYLDGNRCSKFPWTLNTASNSTLFIGGLPDSKIRELEARGIAAGNFIGRIQDVKIYDTALGSEAIAAIFNERKDKYPDLLK